MDPLVPNQVRYRAALHSEEKDNNRLNEFGQIKLQHIAAIYLFLSTEKSCRIDKVAVTKHFPVTYRTAHQASASACNI